MIFSADMALTVAAARKVPREPREFWALVDRPSPEACWTWCGPPVKRLRMRDGRRLNLRSFAYELTYGPPGDVVMPVCATRECINPMHARDGRAETTAEDFWARVERRKGCWLWTGSKAPHGYGQAPGSGRGNGLRLAHRVAWELTRGPIPKGACVLHHCDVRLCVNPDHLFLGSRAMNNRDRDDKGRGASRLTLEHVRRIRIASGTLKEIAEPFGVSASTVHAIRHRRAWRWVK